MKTPLAVLWLLSFVLSTASAARDKSLALYASLAPAESGPL